MTACNSLSEANYGVSVLSIAPCYFQLHMNSYHFIKDSGTKIVSLLNVLR